MHEDANVPWAVREWNARLARRALRRAALRRALLRTAGGAGLAAAGLLGLGALGRGAHSGAPAARRGAAALSGEPRGPAVALAPVTARFYASDDRCTFDAPAAATPVLVARVPTIDFAGRPFADAVPDGPPLPARRGAVAVGVGSLNHFDAAFTGAFVAHRAGAVTFTVLVDDAFTLGVGGGASRVRGVMSGAPPSGRTALARLPVVGAFHRGHLQATTAVTVRFPRPDRYPFELDYAECKRGEAALRLRADGQVPPAWDGASRRAEEVRR